MVPSSGDGYLLLVHLHIEDITSLRKDTKFCLRVLKNINSRVSNVKLCSQCSKCHHVLCSGSSQCCWCCSVVVYG